MYGYDDIYNPSQHGVFAEALQVTMDELDDDETMGAILGIGKGGGVLGIALTQKAKKKKVARLLSKLKKFIDLEEAGKKVSLSKIWSFAKTLNTTLQNLAKKGYDFNDEEEAWIEFYEAGKNNEEAWEDLKDRLGSVSLTGEELEEDYEARPVSATMTPRQFLTSGSGVRGGGQPGMARRRHPAGFRPAAYSRFPRWKKLRWLARHPVAASVVRPQMDPQGFHPGAAPSRPALARRQKAASLRGSRGPRRAERVARGARVGPGGGVLRRKEKGEWVHRGPGGRKVKLTRFGLDDAIEAGAAEAMAGLEGSIEADAFENISGHGLLRADILESTAIDDLLDMEDMLDDDEDSFGLHEFDDFGQDDTGTVALGTSRTKQKKYSAAGRGPFARKLTARLAALQKKYEHQVAVGSPHVGDTLKKLEAVRAHYETMLAKPQIETVHTQYEVSRTSALQDVPLFSPGGGATSGSGTPGVTDEGEFTLADISYVE